jgi:hypothetical protein
MLGRGMRVSRSPDENVLIADSSLSRLRLYLVGEPVRFQCFKQFRELIVAGCDVVVILDA